MPKVPRPDGAASARVQAAARRAGGAWNRHDKASLRDALEVAREYGLPDVKLECGAHPCDSDLICGQVVPWARRLQMSSRSGRVSR